MMVAVGGPAISKKQAAEMFEDDGEDTEDDDDEPTIAMLLAATRWVLALDLPRSPWGAPTAPHQP